MSKQKCKDCEALCIPGTGACYIHQPEYPRSAIACHTKLGNMVEVTGATDVEIKVSAKGDTLWVNTREHACVLRICRIAGRIQIEDERPADLPVFKVGDTVKWPNLDETPIVRIENGCYIYTYGADGKLKEGFLDIPTGNIQFVKV